METLFISSVQRELAGERRALATFIEGDALLRRFFEVFLFEDLPARDRRADAVYLEEVDRCGLYVGLFGSEYGSVDTEGVSPTEREFNRATAAGKPRLVFVKGDATVARDPRMEALISKAGSQLVRRRFRDSGDLISSVYAALVQWLEDSGKLGAVPFDAAPCRGATLADLDEEQIHDFVALARRARGFPLPEDTPMREVLTHLHLLDGSSPTQAAMLLFGKIPQRFLLSSELKCAHFHGTEVAKPIPSYQVYKGTVFRLVDQAVDFVMSKINRWVGTRAESAQAPTEYEIPREVVAEAIVNAVAHRDYTSKGSVQVMLFADRLEVWNPGRLPPSFTLETLRHPHGSVPFNPLLAEPLYLTKYIERLGTGTGDMIRRCREAGLSTPEFTLTDGFVITIRRPEAPSGHQVGTKSADKYPASAPQVKLQEFQEDRDWSILLTGRSLDRFSNAAYRRLEHVPPQVTPQVTPQVLEHGLRVLVLLENESLRRADLQRALELQDRKNFNDSILAPLKTLGWIEFTLPSKPRSQFQRYRLTDEGRAVLWEVLS